MMDLDKSIAIIAIAIMAIFIGCVEERTETLIPVSVPEETTTPHPVLKKTIKILYDDPQASFRTNVECFLANDTTNNNIYTYPDYCCTHFSSDLVANMRDAGFRAHKLTLRTKGEIGHAMVFVYGQNSNLIIEPITDQVFDIDDEIDEYFYDVLGYYPEIITTKS